MDEIETRLKESADACIKAYQNWSSQKKNFEAREKLQEATHELRKVAARLEIEIAVSERDEMTQRPIPIPPHRSSNRRPGGNDLPGFIGGNDDDNAGNQSDVSGNNDRPQQAPRQQRQGGSGGGFQRRPMRPRPQQGGNGGGEE